MLQVAIEAMVEQARKLDPYLKPLLAPLGIFFPFPYHCKLLDSYMKGDSDISSGKAKYNCTGKAKLGGWGQSREEGPFQLVNCACMVGPR